MEEPLGQVCIPMGTCRQPDTDRRAEPTRCCRSPRRLGCQQRSGCRRWPPAGEFTLSDTKPSPGRRPALARMAVVRGSAVVGLRRSEPRCATDRFSTAWICGIDPSATSSLAFPRLEADARQPRIRLQQFKSDQFRYSHTGAVGHRQRLRSWNLQSAPTASRNVARFTIEWRCRRTGTPANSVGTATGKLEISSSVWFLGE